MPGSFIFLATVAGLGLAVMVNAAASEQPSPSDITALLGTWRGSSTCTDRVAAPACQDEVVVYDVRRADKAGVVTLAADKVVDGQRLPMGEFDFTYDQKERCWRTEFQTPRVHAAWCLVVAGTQMTGTLRLLPGGETVRKVQLRRE
jgi:hypothetical protein